MAHYVLRFCLPQEKYTKYQHIYLYYDKLRLGKVTVMDLQRVHKAANINVNGTKLAEILSNLGIKTGLAIQDP